jgi:hypothetical protein
MFVPERLGHVLHDGPTFGELLAEDDAQHLTRVKVRLLAVLKQSKKGPMFRQGSKQQRACMRFVAGSKRGTTIIYTPLYLYVYIYYTHISIYNIYD